MAAVAVLEAHELYRFFHSAEDETLALRGVSLAVFPGEMVAVVGPSGSGKSTLLSCLAGLDEPDGGWVAVGGVRLSRRSEGHRARIRAQRIGFLLQAGNLIDHLSVEENLKLSASFAGNGGAGRIQSTLDDAGISHRATSFPGQLSGGELARAGLALATVNDPTILLADEPTGEVDSFNEERILELIANRSASGGVTLVVTHSDAVARAANRVLRLVDGRIVDA